MINTCFYKGEFENGGKCNTCYSQITPTGSESR